MKKLLLILLFPLILQAQTRWVTGHVPWWDIVTGGQNEEAKTGLDYSALTHIVMFAGGMTTSSGVDSTGSGNIPAALRGPFNNYVHTTYPGKAVLFCMFSRTGESISTAISTDALRKTLAHNIKSFLIADQYDGVDFDFEPISSSDFASGALFIKLLYDTLQTMQAFYDVTKKPIIAADALTPDFWNRSDVYPYMAQINLMRYDQNGSWWGKIWYDCCAYSPSPNSELPSLATGISWMTDSGIPRSKIGIGMSTNGYDFINGVNSSGSNILSPGDVTTTYPTRTSSEIWYWQIRRDWFPGHTVHQDAGAKASYISVANDYKNFPDTTTAWYAVKAAKDSNIGGVMVWTASAQYMNSGYFPSETNRNPMLRAIKNAQINGTVGPATNYVVTSSSYNPTAGTTVTISAQLSDANAMAVSTSGKTVTWSKTGSGGSFATATSTTNTSGVASVVFTTSSTVGTAYTITGTDNTSLTGTSLTITTVTAPPVATSIEITSGNNQSQGINTTLNPFVVTVKDQYGNPFHGSTVTWSVISVPAGAVQSSGKLAAVVGQASGGRASSIAFPGNVTAGNTILVATTVYQPATIPTISKSSGTATISAFTTDGDFNTPFGTTARMNIFRANVTGSGSLTLAISPTTYWGWYWAINEYSGFAASPLDGAQAANAGTSSTYTTGNITLSAAGMIFAHMGDYTGKSFSYPSNSDVLVYKAENWLYGTGITQHKIANAGTYAITATASGSFAYGALSVKYKAAAATAGYSLSQINATTDATGRATTSLTLAPQAGVYAVTASSAGLAGSPVTFNATSSSSVATKYLVTSSSLSPVAGNSVSISAQLADANGAAVTSAGKVVTWSKSGSGGSFSSPTSTTNANGIATVVFTVGTVVGTIYAMTATDDTGLTGTSGTIVVMAQGSDSTATHMVALRQGSNMISTFVAPQQSDVDTIFGDIKSNVGIIKDGSGRVYCPSLGVDQIGSWNSSQGYQVYMSSADTVAFRGRVIAPEQDPISLPQGWNLVPYLRNDALVADSALRTLMGSLILAKDAAGYVYMPSYGINTIGSLKPGQGYQIYVQNPSILTYPPNTNVTPSIVLSKKLIASVASSSYRAEHFKVAYAETGANGVVLVRCTTLKEGDEIAVTTSDGKIVGASAVSNGLAPVTVWGDDPQTEVIDGARDGDHLTVVLWSKQQDRTSQLGIKSIKDGLTGATQDNSLVYRKDFFSVLDALAASESNQVPTVFSLAQNYPNPFNPSTVISYGLPFEAKVRLEVFDLLGRLVNCLVDETQQAGIHYVTFTSGGLTSGMYIYRLQVGTFTATRKLVLLK